MKVIIICNIFIRNRQVNCAALELAVKVIALIFQVSEFSFNYSSLKAGYSTPDTECHSLGLTDKAIPPCRVTRSMALQHPSPGALGWSFLPSRHHGDAGTAAAVSTWAGGWSADNSTEGFLCRTQESREEVQSFVRAHDSQGSESLF